MTGSKSPAICLLLVGQYGLTLWISILKNYRVLLNTWDEAVDIVKDVETKSRIRGVSSQISTFDFFVLRNVE